MDFFKPKNQRYLPKITVPYLPYDVYQKFKIFQTSLHKIFVIFTVFCYVFDLELLCRGN